MNEKICIAAGCSRSALRADNGKRGYCSMHYQRVKKHGDPEIVLVVASPAKDWLAEHVHHEGDECLIWPFSKGRDGYGRVHRNNNGSLTTASHRMCELAHGPKPSPKHEAAHSCGKGHEGCVNPSHLYWATSKQNHQDKVEHGTTNRGEQQGQSRLTREDVRQIRDLAPKLGTGVVANMFGIHQTHVSKIAHMQRWEWLD